MSLAKTREVSVPNDLESFWIPFTPNRAFKAAPRLIARAKDMHYYTPDGRAVLDGIAGMWCTNAGHNRAPIVAAIRAQAAELDYAPAFQFAHPKAFELASQNRARTIGPRLAIHIEIARDPGDIFLPRQDGQRTKIRNAHHIWVMRALVELAGGKASEARALPLHLFHVGRGHHFRLGRSTQLDEGAEEELDAFFV